MNAVLTKRDIEYWLMSINTGILSVSQIKQLHFPSKRHGMAAATGT